MNKQKVVAWVGIDWADEGHEVWEYTVQTDSATCYAITRNPWMLSIGISGGFHRNIHSNRRNGSTTFKPD